MRFRVAERLISLKEAQIISVSRGSMVSLLLLTSHEEQRAEMQMAAQTSLSALGVSQLCDWLNPVKEGGELSVCCFSSDSWDLYLYVTTEFWIFSVAG